jgi:hypothetical protein
VTNVVVTIGYRRGSAQHQYLGKNRVDRGWSLWRFYMDPPEQHHLAVPWRILAVTRTNGQ